MIEPAWAMGKGEGRAKTKPNPNKAKPGEQVANKLQGKAITNAKAEQHTTQKKL